MKTAKILALLALCLCLTSCPQIFDSLTNSTSPHSLSATRGDGTSVDLSWSAPQFKENDLTTVSYYTVYRDGGEAGTTSSTSWSDHPAPATSHSYYVTAKLSTSSTTGASNSAEGWYVPAEVLKLGASPGRLSASDTGWFKTMVVRGWSYHFTATSGSPSISVREWDRPWDQVTSGLSGSLQWTSDRTREIWINVPNNSDLVSWHD